MAFWSWDDPSSLEPALGEKRQDDPDPNNERAISRKWLPLPVDIIHSIYAALDDYQDIENLHIATQIPPSAKVWLELGRRFLCLDQFNFGTNQVNAAKIRRALRRLYHASRRYPRAVNYGAIWDNVETIVARMDIVAHGHETKIDFLSRYKIFDPSPHILSKKTTPPIGNLSVLRMEFSHIGGKRFLCGLTFHKTITGYKGDSSVMARSQGICGLRLVSFGKGFEGVQIKSHTGWEDGWYPPYHTPTASMVVTELTWVPNDDGRIFLSLDAYKICNISYADSASGPVVCPQAWQSQPPPEGCSPVILFDSGSPLQLDPAKALIDHGLRNVTAISGYINPATRHFSCMELSFGGSTYRIGEPANPCCKLLFLLDKDETVVEIAHPAAEGGFAFQFVTNRGRYMVFGLGVFEATRLLVRPAPDGIFYSLSSKTSPHGLELQTFGIFVNDEHSAEPRRQITTPKIQTTQWKLRIVSFTKWFKDRTVFSTEASMASISKIAVIGHEDRIFGLKVFPTDPALPCQVLGYYNRIPGYFTPDSDTDVQYPEKELIIEGELTSMCVHYSVTYEVVGLYFVTSSGQRIEVGDVVSFPQEYIRFAPTQSTLYWLFDHQMDYLTLSDSDVTIRSFPQKKSTLPSR